MLDIHFHILPNVDDGPQTLEESLAMARFCAQDGITHIVATPHCHRHIHLLRADILPRVAALNLELRTAQIPVTILPGSEIQAFDTAAYRREYEAGVFCHLGDKRDFTLLEFSWDREQFPPDAAELVQWIRQQGTTPILAHPERHHYFRSEPHLLQQVIDAGVWVQITVDSLLGNHGPDAKNFAEVYLKSFPEAVLASDAHHLNRCSGLSAGYAWVAENLGAARSKDLRQRSDRMLARLLG
jgi:protein-tyrosine phosphatase